MSEENKSLYNLFECMTEPLNSVNLRRFFLMLFRAHWLDSDNHGTLKEHLSCMRYDDNPKEKTMDIELAHVYDKAKGNSRPAIYVGFDGFGLKSSGIGDVIGHALDNSSRIESKKAETLMRVGHISESADMALMMAESNATLLQGIHKDIMASMDILKVDVQGWSDPVLMEKAPDRNFQVDLTCAVSFNFMVEINIESHRIKKFALQLEAQAC